MQKQVFYIVAADALYPNLCRDTITKATEFALEKDSKFNTAKNRCRAERNLPEQRCHPI